MSTTTTTLNDFPAELRSAIAELAASYAGPLTVEAVGAEIERRFNTAPGGYQGDRLAAAAAQRLAGTYDEFRAEAGL